MTASMEEKIMKIEVQENDLIKRVTSEDYSYIFSKRTGFFARKGKTDKDDPKMCPIGPEILDIEISINGCPNACPFCYKNNKNIPPTNMSFETYKTIIDKIPPTLCQVALGICGVQTNPDFIKMLAYTRSKGIVPNFTLSGIDLTDELADEIVKHIGGLAVSAYESNPNICYDTVKKFTDRGIKQTNIHVMVSKETLPFVYEVLEAQLHDPRLKDMNAVIFLGLKQKGRAIEYNIIDGSEFRGLLEFCEKSRIAIGFDSCSAPKYEAAIRSSARSDADKESLIQYSESCESSLFSLYIDVFGRAWGCSFTENEPGQESVNVLEAQCFTRDVWYNRVMCAFRDRLLATVKDGCRHCPIFKV